MTESPKTESSRTRSAPGRTTAFTLIEILVGMAILTVALTFVYQIWSFLTKGGTTEMWVTETNGKLTVLDTKLREYLSRAGYPSYMTSQGMFSPTSATIEQYYLVKLCGSGDFTAGGSEGTGESGTPALSWIKVNAGTVGIEGKPNKPVTGAKVTLRLCRGHSTAENHLGLADLVLDEDPLNYGSAPQLTQLSSGTFLENGPPLAGGQARRFMTVVSDVRRVKVAARYRSGGTVNDLSGTQYSPCLIRVEIECLEPHRGKRQVNKVIEADTHIGAKTGATP